MKKIILSLPLLLAVISCEVAKPSPQGSETLQKRSDSLAAELAEVKSVLSYVLERGMNSSFEQVKRELENANRVWDLKIDESPSLGNPNAKIVIVEFSEFECPYCARIAPYLDSITRAYPDKIRLVYKNFPLSFHANAPAAAAANLAAQQQGKFWEYRWALAPHFRSLNDSTYIAIAQEIGLDVEQFKKDMVLDAEKRAIIDRDMKLGMEVGVQGTPNFYINGKRQDRFSPALVDQLLRELY
ncbi:MAG: thioredoxin domain-containing protein [Fibromonadaceae bacterium]|jgi:protein-disulfide isomerase|nr:thioredoxin domain-containing protein [Fibromonadaceae bacterium]